MKKKAIVSAAALAVLAAAIIITVALLRHKGLLLPGYIDWQERTLKSDGYEIVLKNRQLKVYKAGECVWEISDSVKVQDVILTDVDRDGVSEITALCWKKGRFGQSRPFFDKEKEEDNTYSEHIYLYDLGPDKPTPKWMASDIGTIVLSIETPNGYILKTYEKDGTVSEWMWVDWGFSKVK